MKSKTNGFNATLQFAVGEHFAVVELKVAVGLNNEH
jgi:hypothetical protein